MRALIAFALFSPVAAIDWRDLRSYTFEMFKAEFGNSHGEAENSKREAIFTTNLLEAITHNEEYAAGKHSWYKNLNEFADWSKEEFRVLRAHRKDLASKAVAPPQRLQVQSNPSEVDWRDKGVVTPVKNQGGCGSCWAFASTETMESHYAIASKKLLVLAPQAYVNCVKNPKQCGGTGGCAGATEELAFNTSAQLGLPLEVDLPYKGEDGECTPYKAAVKNTGFVKLPANDANALETALATKGPIAITVAAGQWSFYGGGIFSGCTGAQGSDLDHDVQAVGYGTENGKGYWLVRNSWGASWGEKGYIRISREADAVITTDTSPADGDACEPYPKSQKVGGMCGILSDSSYPTGMSDSSGSIVV